MTEMLSKHCRTLFGTYGVHRCIKCIVELSHAKSYAKGIL